MSTVEKIALAISELPPEDFAEIREWVLKKDALLWDSQIVDDGAAGKFAGLIEEIESDISQGRVKPLDEVIDHD